VGIIGLLQRHFAKIAADLACFTKFCYITDTQRGYEFQERPMNIRDSRRRSGKKGRGRGRPRRDKEGVREQIPVRVNPKLKKALVSAAAKNRQSLTQEIERRLAASLGLDHRVHVRGLIEAIESLVKDIERRTAKRWTRDAFAAQAIAAAIDTFVFHFGKQGKAVTPPSVAEASAKIDSFETEQPPRKGGFEPSDSVENIATELAGMFPPDKAEAIFRTGLHSLRPKNRRKDFQTPQGFGERVAFDLIRHIEDVSWFADSSGFGRRGPSRSFLDSPWRGPYELWRRLGSGLERNRAVWHKETKS
jgi:hypothetical protein